MRSYTVQPGDSPANVAIKFAGCPKCAVDLVRANPHKKTKRLPNGYETFLEFRAGERISIPEKWFDGRLDKRPPKYFAALPYADGITPSTLGDAATGVLGDYLTHDRATELVKTLPSLDDRAFITAAIEAAALVDLSVREADGNANTGIAAFAQATHISTDWARKSNTKLATATTTADKTAARLEVQTALSTGLESAQLALQALYGEPSLPAPAPIPTPVPMQVPTPIPITPPPPTATQEKKINVGAVVGVGLLAALIGGTIYYVRASR